MKKLTTSIIAIFVFGITGYSQINDDPSTSAKIEAVESKIGAIETSIDLTQVLDDKVPVIIKPDPFKKDTVIYRMPKVIPGTYTISDFGNFIEEFKVFNIEGEELEVNHTDENSWVIINATELDKITYLVNDTFDLENTGEIATPFSPSGTNISEDNFVLNFPGFIGYFETFEHNQYKVNITAHSSFNNSSALQQVGEEFSKDSLKVTRNYYAPRYFDVQDNPMMYGDFDIEEFQVGDIKVVLSVYSPNKIYTAEDLKGIVFEMMDAQKKYLGDINTTA